MNCLHYTSLEIFNPENTFLYRKTHQSTGLKPYRPKQINMFLPSSSKILILPKRGSILGGRRFPITESLIEVKGSFLTFAEGRKLSGNTDC